MAIDVSRSCDEISQNKQRGHQDHQHPDRSKKRFFLKVKIRKNTENFIKRIPSTIQQSTMVASKAFLVVPENQECHFLILYITTYDLSTLELFHSLF
jgi:hypothetical protein